MKNFKITFLNETITKLLEKQQEGRSFSIFERLNTNKTEHNIETFGFRLRRH